MSRTDASIWLMFTALPDSCEPYYFWFETKNGTNYRLPQNDKFYFGTMWPRWHKKAPYKNVYPTDRDCEEMHYYDNGKEIVAMGDEQVPGKARRTVASAAPKSTPSRISQRSRKNELNLATAQKPNQSLVSSFPCQNSKIRFIS